MKNTASSSAAAGAAAVNSKVSLVVMAAGMGSRFGGMKQLEPVGPGGETILGYSLFDARRAGFSEFVFVIRRGMEDGFKAMLPDGLKTGMQVKLAFQEPSSLPGDWASSELARSRLKPWGTGHAVWCAREYLDSPFAVINADDFYGRRSFQLMYDFLAGTDPDSARYAMVGFELGKTLSAHGPVARGICGTDEDGFLTAIAEHTRLRAHAPSSAPDGVVESLRPDGTSELFSSDTPVSMNMFGFTPRFLPALSSLLDEFLSASENDPSAEFYLPEAVQALVSAGSAKVRILRSPETWFGLTYKADAEAVRRSLRRLTDEGAYPGG